MTVADKVAIGTLIVTAILSVLTFVYVMLTCRILRAQWRAVDAQHRAIQAQVLASLMDDYYSTDMLSSMLKLRQFQVSHGAEFARTFGRLRKDNYEEVKPVDEARRRVKRYFFKVFFLLESEVVTERFVKMVIVPSSVGFLREIVEPLEVEINRNYERDRFDRFARMYSDELSRGLGAIEPSACPAGGSVV